MKLIAALSLTIVAAGCEQAYAQAGYYAYDDAPEEITLAAGHGPMTAENGMTLYTFDKDSAPLYFWIGDTAPGDTNGDGVGGVWHIAK